MFGTGRFRIAWSFWTSNGKTTLEKKQSFYCDIGEGREEPPELAGWLALNLTSVTAMTAGHHTFMHPRPVERSTGFSWVSWMPNCLAMDTLGDNYYSVQRNTHRMSSVGSFQAWDLWSMTNLKGYDSISQIWLICIWYDSSSILK